MSCFQNDHWLVYGNLDLEGNALYKTWGYWTSAFLLEIGNHDMRCCSIKNSLVLFHSRQRLLLVLIHFWRKHSKPSSTFYSTHSNLSFLCKYTFMYVYLWVETKGQPQVYLLPLVALPLPFWDILSLRPGSLVAQWILGICLFSFPSLGLQAYTTIPAFYVDANDPNAGAHACVHLSFFPSFKKKSQSKSCLPPYPQVLRS